MKQFVEKSRDCLCYRQSLCISKDLWIRWLCDLVENVSELKDLCLGQYFFVVFVLVIVYIVPDLAQLAALNL